VKLNFLGLQKTSDKILNDLDKIDQLKKIANRNNYEHKVKMLSERLNNEYRFWLAKGPSARLNDVERDLKYIHSQLTNKTFAAAEKVKIAELATKYSID
jgi:hypothetical protein